MSYIIQPGRLGPAHGSSRAALTRARKTRSDVSFSTIATSNPPFSILQSLSDPDSSLCSFFSLTTIKSIAVCPQFPLSNLLAFFTLSALLSACTASALILDRRLHRVRVSL